jgi:hypothetical protein
MSEKNPNEVEIDVVVTEDEADEFATRERTDVGH